MVGYVLNLIITGIPSIPKAENPFSVNFLVLNLIITGIPSIRYAYDDNTLKKICFKPYYNWNTFNTLFIAATKKGFKCFKPYYNWNTFNT